MKKIIAVLFLVLSLFAIMGCNKKDEGIGRVEIWHTYNGAQAEFLEKMASEFNASQEDYEVVVLAQDYSGFNDTVYNAVANGIGPSIIFNFASTAVDYIQADLAVDITDYIKADVKAGDTSMQDVIDSLPEAMKTDVVGFADGGIYYLPGCTTGPVFFYNKTIFDELGLNPPTSWAELESVSKTIKEKKGIPGFLSDSIIDTLQALIMQNGLGYIDVDAKKVTFCNDKLVEIFDWYKDCCKKGYFAFNTVGSYSSDDLGNGDVASFAGSCVNDQYISMVKGELGMAPWIAKDVESFFTAWNRGPIFLKRNAKADKGAYEFIKYFMSAKNNGEWAKINSAISPYGTTEKDSAYQEYINSLPENSALACVRANLNLAGSFPNIPGSSQVRRYIEEYINYVVDGSLSAKDAVSQLEEVCNKALNGK